MDGLLNTDMCPPTQHHSRAEDEACGIQAGESPSTASPADREFSETIHVLGQTAFDEEDLTRLLTSFDMVFQLHQRSEEIRDHLEKIDAILLKSRTVTGLIERVTHSLETDLDLTAARILIRSDHPVSSIFRLTSPSGGDTISSHFLATDSATTDPFILDDPSGDLSFTLFGESAAVIGSAAVAYLCHDKEELGLLCLGSSDPRRYCGDMNTDLIASVADKIALGITNAWDHENAMRAMVKSHAQGIFNESFFFEYLDKELHRAWRNRRPFSLAAMSWSSSDSGCSPSSAEVADLVLRNIRSSDLVAQGDTVNFWSLLPDTDANAAKNMAQRLLDAAAERFDGDLALHVGITEFSKDAAVLSTLTDAAKSALRQAQEEHTRIVVRAC